jgi:hypothetical protein
MIVTSSESATQLTYSLEEYEQFSRAAAAFRKEINSTLRSEILNLNRESKKYFRKLMDEFIQSLEYIDRTVIVTRAGAGIQLTFSVKKYTKFNDNIGFLRLDLCGFQEAYHYEGEHEKANALEAAQDLIDIFIRLLGDKITLDA